MNVLSEKIKSAPKSPGCYIFRDNHGVIIYVGKAKNLSNRVKQYFQDSDFEWSKLNKLVKLIADVEYIETDSELDALLMEYKLIKDHKPWFNTQMKDDVEHPLLRIDCSYAYPTISIVNDRKDANANYFDGFFDKDDAEGAIKTLNSAWNTSLCGDYQHRKNAKPCMSFHVGKCDGPCGGMVDVDEYRQKISGIIGFLQGKDSSKINEIRREMKAYSDALKFEKAENCRMLLEKLEWLQRKSSSRMYDMSQAKHVILLIRPYKCLDFSMFCFMDGEVVYREDIASVKNTPLDRGLALVI